MSASKKSKVCRHCRLPFATRADVRQAMTSIYMDGDSICWYDGICWYGPGSAYSAGKCTRPAHKKTKVGPPRGYAWIVALAHERTVARSELIDRVEAALKKYQGTPISIRSLASIIVTAAPVLLERRRG